MYPLTTLRVPFEPTGPLEHWGDRDGAGLPFITRPRPQGHTDPGHHFRLLEGSTNHFILGTTAPHPCQCGQIQEQRIAMRHF